MHPLVSVIIPVYNRENTIMRSLNSVLMQTYSNIEVIIIDDASTDATLQALEECNDDRVKIVQSSFNGGANVARNKGIKIAKGMFIAFQDSDDEWLADKLDKQINYMLENNVEVSYSPYLLYENNKWSIVPSNYKDKYFCKDNLIEILKKNNVVGTPTLVVKNSVFFEVGLFDEEMERMQDYELILRLAKKYKIGYIDEPLVKVYRMKESISTNNEVLSDTYVKLLERHIDFLDIEKFLYDYYKSCDFSCCSELRWRDIDRITSVIKNYEDEKLEKSHYQITIKYLYEQLATIKGVIKNWYYFFVKHIETSKFAIYGAGVYGHKAYEDLKKKDCIPKCFIVTKKNEKNEVDNIPIVSIDELSDLDISIIIAVSWDKQYDLIQNLLKRNMNKFCIYPFCH